MLPPVLEIFVIWHPKDQEGARLAEEFIDHFHSSAFTGLIGGAVEVFVRSVPWDRQHGAPRPIPSAKTPMPAHVDHAQFTVLVPLLGTEMAADVEDKKSHWRDYLSQVVELNESEPESYALFPYLMSKGADTGTVLGAIFSRYQRIAASECDTEADNLKWMRCRELAQGITQFLRQGSDGRLTVFISHTKHSSERGRESHRNLVETTRKIIRDTRLREFFDANDLQPGDDWDNTLQINASTSALLAIRTDLYSSRLWCQREMRLAKQSGMPVVILDALHDGESRGSFLMDHVPRIPTQPIEGEWSRKDIYRVLNTLVDECLKRELWRCQKELADSTGDYDVTWWAPHAPELLTLLDWINRERLPKTFIGSGMAMRVLHPDPPLGKDERQVLEDALALCGLSAEIMTPRQLAARGG